MTQPLHPDIAAAIEHIPAFDMNDEAIQLARTFPPSQLPTFEALDSTEHLVPGAPAVRVVVRRPKRFDGPLPCVYGIHGGGYIVDATDVLMLDSWCEALGIVGVLVDYRLAPETPYPGALEDCYVGLRWIVEHATELGVDPTRVGVFGVSAGGGLAAALALLARDRGDISVAFQLLDSPMLDDRQITFSSQRNDLLVWSRGSNMYGWRAYLGELHGRHDIPITAAPGRAAVADLVGLPPAFVAVGALDGFLDEAVGYALRLNHAGVPTELHVYPGACHGYQLARECKITKQFRRQAEEWLHEQLAR